jgi:hypothetical protein
MIRYSLVQFFKMVSFPHKADPVQTLREEDGFELSRALGDCVISAHYKKEGWVEELPIANVARARVIAAAPAAPVDKASESTRPFMRAAEILTAPAEKAKKR